MMQLFNEHVTRACRNTIGIPREGTALSVPVSDQLSNRKLAAICSFFSHAKYACVHIACENPSAIKR
jgi:hypothetical protein